MILIIVFGIGYLISTFGFFLFTIFFVPAITPHNYQRINSSTIYKEYNSGIEDSKLGRVQVCLYKNYKYFPFFEKKFFQKNYIHDPNNEYVNKISPENSKINNKPSFGASSFKVKYDTLKNEVILQSDNNYDTLHLNEPY